MTREIKFRGWNGLEMVFGWGVFTNENSKPYIITDGANLEVKDAMQFTGFRIEDKDLYEGDILLYPDTESEYVDVGMGNVKVAEQGMNSFWPVEFREGEFGFEVKDGEVIDEGWISLRNFFGDYIKPDKCEIIGNIHENEDLIV